MAFDKSHPVALAIIFTAVAVAATLAIRWLIASVPIVTEPIVLSILFTFNAFLIFLFSLYWVRGIGGRAKPGDYDA